jgi:putative mycofactocin binding protein MftB
VGGAGGGGNSIGLKRDIHCLFFHPLPTSPLKGEGRMRIMNTRYKLATGSQVREEDFGLLFYRMNGPRLYFISSGDLLTPEFFNGVMTLDEWMIHNRINDTDEVTISELEKTFSQLSEKGVIIEC